MKRFRVTSIVKPIGASISLCALLVVAPTSSALAGKLSAVINGKSYHVDSSYAWNEANYGVGVEYQLTGASRWKTVAMANGFRDSNDAMSYMAGAGLHRRLFESERLAGLYFDVGLNAFLMTRKDVNDNRPFPGILPSLTVGNRHMGFNLTYLPKKAVQDVLKANMTDPTISGILFLQFKLSIDRLLPIAASKP